MKRSMISLVAILFLAILTVAPLTAQEPAPMAPDQDEDLFEGPGPGMGPGQGMFKQLDLSTEQIEKLRDMRTSHQKEMIPLRAELKVARIELRELVRAGDNTSAIDAKIDQIGKLQTQLEKKRVQNQLQMRSILTPEQRQKMEMGRAGFGDGCHGKQGHSRRVPRADRMPGCGRP